VDATPEQRTYARLAAVCLLADYLLQGLGDSVTIVLRRGEAPAEVARFAASHYLLWRISLLEVGLSWIAIGILACALHALLEPVDRSLARLALCLRLGGSFVGAASLMFRVAQGRLYFEAASNGPFTAEQLRVLVAVLRRGAGEGVELAWMFQGGGTLLFFWLFLRSRYLPPALARVGLVGAVLLIAMSGVMFVLPQYVGPLKLLGAPGFAADVGTAAWLLARGPRPPRP
jgi:hypothetical protein